MEGMDHIEDRRTTGQGWRDIGMKQDNRGQLEWLRHPKVQQQGHYVKGRRESGADELQRSTGRKGISSSTIEPEETLQLVTRLRQGKARWRDGKESIDGSIHPFIHSINQFHQKHDEMKESGNINSPEFINLQKELQLQIYLYQKSKVISKKQTDQLKAQIYAFKHHLTKQIPLPNCLIEAIQGIDTEKNLNDYKQYFAIYLKPQIINNAQQQQQQNGTRINQSLEIPKIDMNILVHERDKLIHAKLKLKYEELQKQLNSNPQDKLKLLIQLQSIRLYDIQKKNQK